MSVQSVIQFRVRYCETDQMGTYSNSRVLEWFECGRTELFRTIGLPYAEMERKGVMLPVIEANIKYTGRAKYDDLLKMITTCKLISRVRIRCDVKIVHAKNNQPVAEGYTVHAFTNAAGKVIRPPDWLIRTLEAASS
ncbi:MAG: acyl-CoA thioesterase [Planctomycetes bacterium]|nr:acyl-CoA thioesterase [Planctomycetota bacterium]